MLCFKNGIKWWVLIIIGILLIIFGILFIIFFLSIVRFLIELQLNYVYNSPSEWWTQSSDRLFKVYVYNITNSNEFLKNQSNLIRLQELGPYVYDEKWEYINVIKNSNDTVSFNLNIFREFRRDLSSSSSETDLIITPNIEILSSSTNNLENISPFKGITVKQLLWASDNPRTGEIESPGLLQIRNDITLDRVTVFTKKRQKGVVDKYNGQLFLTNSLNSYCDRLNGSYNMIFPDKLTKTNMLNVFNNDLKHIIPLYYKKLKLLSNGIQAKHYVMPEDFFENPLYDLENICYCPVDLQTCLDTKNSGLFKITFFKETNSDIIYSLPHFYLADKSLRKKFTGISSPEKKFHQMFVDVHPASGLTVRSRTGLQMNYAAQPQSNTNIKNPFTNIIFPLIWFEEIYENLPNDVLNVTILPRQIMFGIIIIFLIIGIVLLCLAIYCLLRNSKKQQRLQIQINMAKIKTDPHQTKVNVRNSTS